MSQDMGHAYATEVEQNLHAMQSSPQTDQQAFAVKAMQEANTVSTEIGTVLH